MTSKLCAPLLAAVAACLPVAPDARAQQAAPPHNDFQQRRMSAEEADVWRVVESWNSAFAANDVERYFSFLDPDVVVLTASNPYRVEGKADDRSEFGFGLERGHSRVAYFEEVAPLVRIIGDVAIVTYFNRGWYGAEGGQMVYLKETNVLARRDGGWRIVHIHVSK